MDKKTISAPIINPLARDRLYEVIQRSQVPQTVETTLANALNGSIWEQRLLFVAMVDTWPRLQKALEEVAREVAKAPFEVRPYSARNEDPSQAAIEKAAFVEDSLRFRGDPIAHQLGFKGFLESLGQSYFYGVSAFELLWKQQGLSLALDGVAAVDPVYFRYPRLTNEPDRLMLNPTGHQNGGLVDFPEHRFLVAIKSAHLGHPAVAAPLRSLVQYWVAANWGLKWMLRFAEQFGVPMRWATVPEGDNDTMDAVSCMLESIGSAGWGVFPTGTTVDIKEASRSAGELPQAALVDLADRQVDIRILGQSLTTDVGDSGSRALGDVHKSIRSGVIEGIANWQADLISSQLVPSILELGGFDSNVDAPEYVVDWPESTDQKIDAEVSEILFSRLGLPVGLDYLYDKHGVAKPDAKTELFSPPSPQDLAPSPQDLAPSPQDLAPSPQDSPSDQDLAPSPQDSPSDQDLAPDQESPSDQAPELSAALGDATGGVFDSRSLDELTDNVLEDVSGTAAAYLAGVRPFFKRLVDAALNESLSHDDFLDTLENASAKLPELFDEMKPEILEQALVDAIGTAMISGAGEQAKDA